MVFLINPQVRNNSLNALFAAAWLEHVASDFAAHHTYSLVFICAFAAAGERGKTLEVAQNLEFPPEGDLIGYVNVAWDGGVHAFLLDTTVHPSWRRRGVGMELVRLATEAARERGAQWLHVDHEPGLEAFYRRCGFTPTQAGLIRLVEDKRSGNPLHRGGTCDEEGECER